MLMLDLWSYAWNRLHVYFCYPLVSFEYLSYYFILLFLVSCRRRVVVLVESIPDCCRFTPPNFLVIFFKGNMEKMIKENCTAVNVRGLGENSWSAL